MAAPPPTEKLILFTDICSLYWESKKISERPDSRFRDTESIDTKLGMLRGHWRETYPEDKEFKCPEPAHLCFEMCRVVMSPTEGPWHPAPQGAGCDNKLTEDHACVVAENRVCKSDTIHCRWARNRTTYARCGGITEHAVRRQCATMIEVLDHWEKTPTSTK